MSSLPAWNLVGPVGIVDFASHEVAAINGAGRGDCVDAGAG